MSSWNIRSNYRSRQHTLNKIFQVVLRQVRLIRCRARRVGLHYSRKRNTHGLGSGTRVITILPTNLILVLCPKPIVTSGTSSLSHLAMPREFCSISPVILVSHTTGGPSNAIHCSGIVRLGVIPRMINDRIHTARVIQQQHHVRSNRGRTQQRSLKGRERIDRRSNIRSQRSSEQQRDQPGIGPSAFID